MPILTPEAVEFATELFNEVDTDKSGTIDIAEMKVGATKIAEFLEMPPPTEDEIQARMDALDIDGDGVVTLDEFLTFMAMIKVLLVCGAMFKAVDTDGSGSIDAKELKVVMTNIYESEGFDPPSDEEVAETLADLDTSGTGTIDFLDFANLMIPIIIEMAEEE